MSRSTDEDVVAYVREKMPERVRKALADAKWNLYYGASDPDEDIEMTWTEASKIVEDWWDDHMRDDLIVDDAGNVSTQHDFSRWLHRLYKEREEEALQEAIDQGIGDMEEDEWEATEAREKYAKQEAASYADSAQEEATLYHERDVRRLVLGKDWP